MNSHYNVSLVATVGAGGCVLGLGPTRGSQTCWCEPFLCSPLSTVCPRHPLTRGVHPPPTPSQPSGLQACILPWSPSAPEATAPSVLSSYSLQL